MQEIAQIVATNEVEKKLKDMILDGKIVIPEAKAEALQFEIQNFMKSGNRKFFQTLKGELEKIPVDVMVSIKGKQKNLAKVADSLTNIVRFLVSGGAQAVQQIPGLGKTFNEILESSGLSPIDFTQITKAPAQPVSATPAAPVAEPVAAAA
jgi:hypothetical protein